MSRDSIVNAWSNMDIRDLMIAPQEARLYKTQVDVIVETKPETVKQAKAATKSVTQAAEQAAFENLSTYVKDETVKNLTPKEILQYRRAMLIAGMDLKELEAYAKKHPELFE